MRQFADRAVRGIHQNEIEKTREKSRGDDLVALGRKARMRPFRSWSRGRECAGLSVAAEHRELSAVREALHEHDRRAAAIRIDANVRVARAQTGGQAPTLSRGRLDTMQIRARFELAKLIRLVEYDEPPVARPRKTRTRNARRQPPVRGAVLPHKADLAQTRRGATRVSELRPVGREPGCRLNRAARRQKATERIGGADAQTLHAVLRELPPQRAQTLPPHLSKCTVIEPGSKRRGVSDRHITTGAVARLVEPIQKRLAEEVGRVAERPKIEAKGGLVHPLELSGASGLVDQHFRESVAAAAKRGAARFLPYRQSFDEPGRLQGIGEEKRRATEQTPAEAVDPVGLLDVNDVGQFMREHHPQPGLGGPRIGPIKARAPDLDGGVRKRNRETVRRVVRILNNDLEARHSHPVPVFETGENLKCQGKSPAGDLLHLSVKMNLHPARLHGAKAIPWRQLSGRHGGGIENRNRQGAQHHRDPKPHSCTHARLSHPGRLERS